MWRTTPWHRRELAGSSEVDGPPELPGEVDRHRVQTPGQGVGSLYHRRFVGRIRSARITPEQLIARVAADPNCVAPTTLARFIKVAGAEGVIHVGDEFVVRMPGPWDGPIRVARADSTSLRFATLAGHLEAGQVEFRASLEGADLLFWVETWACSGDRLSMLLYQHVRMAKEVQFHMWTSVVERAARLSGGRLVGGIDVETRRVDRPAGGDRRLGDPDARTSLDRLHDLAWNYDPDRADDLTADQGWQRDEYRRRLPPELPGDPRPGGPWEVAARLIRGYEFADPAMIRAVYHREQPLENRDMLLEARFHGLRFLFGVRVSGVRDEQAAIDGRPVRIWGWNYRTLQGHVEMGQMDFEVWKWLDSGEVEFVTRRYSHPARIRNLLLRIGFRLLGRREQVRFAERACERMATLTAAELDGGLPRAPLSRVADAVRVRPASTTTATSKKLA